MCASFLNDDPWPVSVLLCVSFDKESVIKKTEEENDNINRFDREWGGEGGTLRGRVYAPTGHLFCLVTCMYQCTSKVLVQVSANEPVHSILLFLVLREHNETNAVMSQCRDGVTVVL